MENPQKSLESARQRFSQLVSALTAFNNVLRHGPPDQLPPWCVPSLFYIPPPPLALSFFPPPPLSLPSPISSPSTPSPPN